MKIHYNPEWDTFYQSEDDMAWHKIQLGKLQKNLLQFAYRFPTLHTYDVKLCEKQVLRLAEMGLLYHYPETQQFRIRGVS